MQITQTDYNMVVEENGKLKGEIAQLISHMKGSIPPDEAKEIREIAFAQEQKATFLENLLEECLKYVWQNHHKCEVCKNFLTALNQNLDKIRPKQEGNA